VTGRIGDFFRFFWALFYWNTRKTWFRLRGAQRDDCPCQTYSDSGHAFDSRCEAMLHWQQPARFRRVCPLLVQTPQGWRCSVNAESVRPFWGRAFLYAGATVLTLYLMATLAVYGALRLARYDASYLAVAWPLRWGELRDSQEKLYATRAQRALQAGNYQEAILSLERVTQLNPRNYAASLALAGLNLVAGRTHVAEHIYQRLMRDVPEHRRQTAQIWFRDLLARGAYPTIKDLATIMLNEDPGERTAWINALLFACRQTSDHAYLGKVLAENPHLPDWCTELIGIEQLLLQGHLDRALPRLTRVHRQPPTGYVPYYQADRLLRHGATDQALDLIRAYGRLLPPDEAGFLRLRIYQAKDWPALIKSESDTLLGYEMAPRIVAQFCALLIAHPDAELFARYADRFAAANLPVDNGTASLYQATFVAATVTGDTHRASEVVARISQYTSSDARVLRGLGELLKDGRADPRLARILPLVPLPTEVIYAILDRPVAPAPVSK
jgi:tetratricopeptide (TPR) repeat protein